jgi:hypothetical protein
MKCNLHPRLFLASQRSPKRADPGVGHLHKKQFLAKPEGDSAGHYDQAERPKAREMQYCGPTPEAKTTTELFTRTFARWDLTSRFLQEGVRPRA